MTMAAHTATTLQEDKPSLLEMRSITKRFPGVLALSEVNFTVRQNEVVALVGENGAGKSTLMKILSGVYTADSGEFIFKGKPIYFTNPLLSGSVMQSQKELLL